MKIFLPFLLAVVLFIRCKENGGSATISDQVIAKGQMPNLTKDQPGNLHLVYGSGDSILHAVSENGGKSFSAPALVASLPELAASHTRGPQIASTNDGLVVTACNRAGNIYAFQKVGSGSWLKTGQVNDVDTIAKENLMALSADGQNAFAVWLDLRSGHNQVYGAASGDGGKTWSKNILVYSSPDTTVCECCKPSVAMKGSNVSVMFRNWLHGNRDLYLIQSSNGGASFGTAQKLGNESWALKGCPMDGGALVIGSNGSPQTVWNRKGTIYASEPGKEEKSLGKGRSCTMETVNGKNVYAWVENGEVVMLKPQGMKQVLGKGSFPVLKAVNNEHVLCVWENEKQIHEAVVEL